MRASRQTDLGLELHCARCDEFWPADAEFFYPESRSAHGFHSWCIACFVEWRRARLFRPTVADVEEAKQSLVVALPLSRDAADRALALVRSHRQQLKAVRALVHEYGIGNDEAYAAINAATALLRVGRTRAA